MLLPQPRIVTTALEIGLAGAKISSHRSIVILPIQSSRGTDASKPHSQWFPHIIQNWCLSLCVCGSVPLIMWFPELGWGVSHPRFAYCLLLFKQAVSNQFTRPLLTLWAPLLQLVKCRVSLGFLFFSDLMWLRVHKHHPCMCVRSEDNLWGVVLSFYHVGSEEWIQVIRFRTKLPSSVAHEQPCQPRFSSSHKAFPL